MTTVSYKDLLQLRAALEAQIKEAHQRENAEAIAKVRALIADFDLTPKDVFPAGKMRGAKSAGAADGSKTKVAAKYRNPETGDTWTGRGKPPRWISNQDRSQFLISQIHYRQR